MIDDRIVNAVKKLSRKRVVLTVTLLVAVSVAAIVLAASTFPPTFDHIVSGQPVSSTKMKDDLLAIVNKVTALDTQLINLVPIGNFSGVSKYTSLAQRPWPRLHPSLKPPNNLPLSEFLRYNFCYIRRFVKFYLGQF